MRRQNKDVICKKLTPALTKYDGLEATTFSLVTVSHICNHGQMIEEQEMEEDPGDAKSVGVVSKSPCIA